MKQEMAPFVAYHENSFIINSKNENSYLFFGICLTLSQMYLLFFKGFASNFKVFMHIIGFDHVWFNQCTFSKTRLVHSVFNKLQDSYSCYWKFCIFDDRKNSVNGSKMRTYRTVKVNYEREMY